MANIILTYDQWGVGGAEKMLSFVANVCIEDNHDVTLIFFSKCEDTQFYLDKRIKVKFLGEKFKDTRLTLFNREKKRISLLIKFRSVIKKITPDLVFIFGRTLSFWGNLLLLGTRIKTISSERSCPGSSDRVHHFLYTLGYILSNKIVFQTVGASSYFCKRIRDKSIIIENPCYYTNVHHSKNNSNIVVSVGRLDNHSKRFDILIKAFKLFYKRHKEFKLCIYGDGPDRKKLQDIILSENLEDCVFLMGTTKNPQNDIADKSMFVLSSAYEGMPNILIEAMSTGIPCISTDCPTGGPRYLLNNGDRGLLVPVDDSSAIADAMCYYAENPDVAKNYGIKGMEIKDELSPQIIAEKWRRLIKYTLH